MIRLEASFATLSAFPVLEPVKSGAELKPKIQN